MPALDDDLVRWTTRIAAPGADVAEIRGLRDGGSPWLLRLSKRDGARNVVLRVGEPDNLSALRTEIAALEIGAMHALPAPKLIAAELTGDRPVVLTEMLAGSSTIPRERPRSRLYALGAVAASLHIISVEPQPDLPWRDHPIPSVDFAALRREPPISAVLLQAEEMVAATLPSGNAVFVHGDLWQGNSMWLDDELVGLVDWDCAGIGLAGVDLGSLRCDAAMCFGLSAADDVRLGWEETAGRPADDVAYWDVVAALSTPPDIGWFAGAIAGQGRHDLTRGVLLQRRDAFLRVAMEQLVN